ncbi:MAG: ACT domain-containing protein [Myxococcales bacterium]|nr:MAG: ACT domain-containing protein [Myxococcales bacterium]
MRSRSGSAGTRPRACAESVSTIVAGGAARFADPSRAGVPLGSADATTSPPVAARGAVGYRRVMAASSPAVISVIGHDQKGVVARVSTYLAQHSVNIENIEQRVMEGLFIMTMLVDLADITVSLDRLILDLKEIGGGLQMDVTVRLHGEKTRKRIALLVSKEPHCLEAILNDHAAGELEADIVGVLSNHPDLESLATARGLPFLWQPSSDKAAHMRFVHDRVLDGNRTWSFSRATCRC